MQRILTVSVLAILAVPGMAWAADAAGSGDMAKAFAVLAAGLGFGLAAGLCGLGQGRAAGSAVDAMAQQPPSPAQLDYLKSLGDLGPTPANMAEASQRIARLKGEVAS